MCIHSSSRKRTANALGITPQGARALRDYIEQARVQGPSKRKLYAAVALTGAQRAATVEALRRLWRNPNFVCPAQLALKPLHGYESRVLKDGFTSAQYCAWLMIGCADAAVVKCDRSGRPFLFTTGMVDVTERVYDLIVPIRSDSKGNVSIDDVIPKGLAPRTRK
jgi:hypothetical protein